MVVGKNHRRSGSDMRKLGDCEGRRLNGDLNGVTDDLSNTTGKHRNILCTQHSIWMPEV